MLGIGAATFLLAVVSSVTANGNKFCDLSCPTSEGHIVHTVCSRERLKCGGGKSCGPDFKEIQLTDLERQYILDIHNYLRNYVAVGKEQRGHQPPAANMNTLRYNKELEFIAQCWVNECHEDIIAHDKCRKTENHSWVGQNLAYIASTDSLQLRQKNTMIKKLILGWYNEVAIYKNNWVHDHESRMAKIGHYTALIWADTKEVGCALSYYSYVEQGLKWYALKLACNYGPGGNIIGQPVYKIGKPATKCSRRKNNKRFPGLCGVDILVNQTRNYENNFFNYRI